MTWDEARMEMVARAAHEANRAYCLSLGDMSQVSWEDAPDWQRESAIAGVRGVVECGNGPADSHASWLDLKRRDGWVYGEVKDPAKKTHPCMVPYEHLPEAQRRKDGIFVGVVRVFLGVLHGLPQEPHAPLGH